MKWYDDREPSLVGYILLPIALGLFFILAIFLCYFRWVYSLFAESSASSWARTRRARPMVYIPYMMGDDPDEPELPPVEYMPDDFGWRYWHWSPTRRTLCSPYYRTVWRESEFWAKNWKDRPGSGEERNVAGIHAAKAPVDWWQRKNSELREVGTSGTHSSISANVEIGDCLPHLDDEVVIQGIVEKFGGFVRGTRGWRAEMVVIIEFLAPNTTIGLQLEQAFPDVPVRYLDPPIEIIPPAEPEIF